MLQNLFLKVLDMSISASYCAVFICLIRVLFKKFPKIYFYALWSVVFLRLLCPFSWESTFSLLPADRVSVLEWVDEMEQTEKMQEQKETFLIGMNQLQQQEDEVVQEHLEILNSKNDTYIVQNKSFENQKQVESLEEVQNKTVDRNLLVSMIWLITAIGFIVYGIVSHIFLKKKCNDAQRIEENIFEMADLPTAFVIGLLCPRIYLPKQLEEPYRSYVLAHEKVHIRRKDYLIKLIAYLLVCVHWFNLSIWLAFYLMCQDMEMSCDEQVLQSFDAKEKKLYSMALLSVASGRKLQFGKPIAFCESDAKKRIKNILQYRKRSIWFAFLIGGLVVGIIFGLLSNPKPKKEQTNEKIDKTSEMQDVMEQEVSFVEAYIYENRLKDKEDLSNTLSRGINLGFLLEEFEEAKKIDVTEFVGVLFDIAEEEFYIGDDVLYYFDAEKLVDSFCKATGQTQEEYLKQHEEMQDCQKIYQQVDGDNMTCQIEVKSVTWQNDTFVEIRYECWSDDYHLWDGILVMRKNSDRMKPLEYVSNQRENRPVEMVSTKQIETKRKILEVLPYQVPKERFLELAKEITGDEEVKIEYHSSVYDEKSVYGVIGCHKNNPQFNNLGEIVVQWDMKDQTIEVLAYMQPQSGNYMSGLYLCQDYLFWSYCEESWDIYQYDLIEKKLTVWKENVAEWNQGVEFLVMNQKCVYVIGGLKQAEKIYVYEPDSQTETLLTKADMEFQWYVLAMKNQVAEGKAAGVLSKNPTVLVIYDFETGQIEQNITLADSYEYGYLNHNGYLIYTNADSDIWLHCVENGKSAKLIEKKYDGKWKFYCIEGKFILTKDDCVEVIDMENQVSMKYQLK